jgi:hypothetical protein|tara:strand:- start:501 stop:1256 length:756 start_codon:yes stop_codon:yes gene_type:complete
MADYVFCTTFNKKLYDDYAHQLIDTFIATKQIPMMYVYVEDNPDWYPKIPRVHYYNIFDYEPALKDFIERNKHRKANTFYEEAIRFSYKVFAQSAARNRGEKIFYVDSDCKFMGTIPEEWYNQCLPDDTLISFYDRPSQYTETGFVAFNNTPNNNHSICNQFFNAYRDWYVTDKVYTINKLEKNFWTDCHTLDGTRQMFKDNPAYIEKILGDGKNGHIMARDKFINPYIDHRKGPRKKQSNSPEWRKNNDR